MDDDFSTPNADDPPLERVQSSGVTARVPDAVGAGVFATGVIVLQSPTEVIIDFVQAMANPQRIEARVVMPPVVARQFAEALAENIGLYARNFGNPPQEPKPQPPAGATQKEASAPAPQTGPIADAYDRLKVPDDVLGGAYANTVTISHSPSEFHFDFINRGFPRSVVTCRVYMAAPRAPALLDSLKRSLGQG